MPALLDLSPVVSHVHCGEISSVLRRVSKPGVNLAIWERAPLPAAAQAIQAILDASAPMDIDLHAPKAEQLAAEILRQTFADSAPAIRELAADCVLLAGHFAELAAIRHVRLRLNRVDDDGCALFHADSLSLRLLCLYAGPGTQWLENDNVRRDELGTRSRTLDEANRAIVIEPAAIRTIPNWHAAAFKGRAWPGEEDNALIHRSAPVTQHNARRIRLTLDSPKNCGC